MVKWGSFPKLDHLTWNYPFILQISPPKAVPLHIATEASDTWCAAHGSGTDDYKATVYSVILPNSTSNYSNSVGIF